MKLDQIVTEGPLDFMRGAAGEVGRMVARSAPVRAARNIIGAGQAASHAADYRRSLNDLVARFVQIHSQLVKLTGQFPTPPKPPVAQTRVTARPAPKPQQPPSPIPDAFRTATPAKMTPGQYGPMYQFSDFLKDYDGLMLQEAPIDFARGVARHGVDALGRYVKDRLPMMSKFQQAFDVGMVASRTADERRAKIMRVKLRQELATVVEQLRQITTNNPAVWQQIRQLLRQMTKDPRTVEHAMRQSVMRTPV